MCFIGYKNCCYKHIADSDITIYKILNNNWTSPYQHFQYKRGVVYTKPIVLEFLNRDYPITLMQGKGNFIINQGLHCFKYIFAAKNLIENSSLKCRDVIIVRGYIPKGTVYYINDEFEIVTNSYVLTYEELSYNFNNK